MKKFKENSRKIIPYIGSFCLGYSLVGIFGFIEGIFLSTALLIAYYGYR